MKTTDAPLRGAAITALVSGAAVVAIAAAVAGGEGAQGAAVGSLVAVAVLGLGALAVAFVARLMPAASLLFAMLTYTCQVLVMALILVGLDRSGWLAEPVVRWWLGVAIIVVVLAWTVMHVRRSMTARIPAFETATEGTDAGPAQAALTSTEGGAR